MTRPDQVLAVLSGRTPTSAGRRVLRVLAARQLLQAVIVHVRPTPRILAVGAVVDGLHAATCFGFATRSVEWRRAALLDGCAATIIGAVTGVAARRR